MARPTGFDIVIVGSGAAGAVLARRLGERGDVSVLLIEAGPDQRPDPTVEGGLGWRLPKIADWGFVSEPDASGTAKPLRRGRLLGGSSWFARFALRGPATDFDAWAAAGNPGWRFADVLPAFRRMEADAEFGDAPWHGAEGPLPVSRHPGLARSGIHRAAVEAFVAAGFAVVDDHNAPDAAGIGSLPMSLRDGRRVPTIDAWLPPDSRPASLTIRTDTPIETVRIDRGRATGVRLADGSVIDADTVVLAAGTYGSPAILLRSGIGPAEDLARVDVPVLLDLPGVGRNLADHPAVDLDSGWRGEGTGGPLLHSIATFRSSTAPPDGPPDLLFWLSDPDVADPAFYLDPVLLKPASRGSVTLRSADPADPPRIALPGLRESIDIDRLVEGYAVGLGVAARPEMRLPGGGSLQGSAASRADLRRRVIENAYSLPHVVGTCRMGPAAGDGAVVDHLGRVHGIAGLRVVDASIMPDAPAGFPHAVTIMIAEHLAPTI